MSLSYAQASEIVRGRLNLPVSAKLRIQKNIANALEVFSDRMIENETTRYILLTPKTVTGTPVNGILDLSGLVTSNGLRIDDLHLGNIYNQPIRTFTTTNVDLTNNVISLANNRLTRGTRIHFTTTNTLPAPLLTNGHYYSAYDDRENTSIKIYGDAGLTTRVTLTSVGIGTQTILTDTAEEQPLSMLTNPELTSYPIAWMNTSTDKFWWLIGSTLYAFAGDGSPINTVLQFNVPKTVTLSDFSSSPVNSLQDQFINALVEITSQSMAKDTNG